MLEIAYEANSEENVERKKILILKMLAKVKLVDFLLNMADDKKLLTARKYIKIATKLDDIARYSSGWVKKIEKK